MRSQKVLSKSFAEHNPMPVSDWTPTNFGWYKLGEVYRWSTVGRNSLQDEHPEPEVPLPAAPAHDVRVK